jgi:hypothetical protein
MLGKSSKPLICGLLIQNQQVEGLISSALTIFSMSCRKMPARKHF